MTKGSIIGTSVLLLLGVASANAGPCTEAIDGVSKMMASRDAGTGPTVGAAPPQAGTTAQGSPTQQHPPTAIIGKETEGRAASPQDVQRQTGGQPTAGEQSQKETGTPPLSVAEALNRARVLDQQGKEAECMAAVQQAKQLVGSK